MQSITHVKSLNTGGSELINRSDLCRVEKKIFLGGSIIEREKLSAPQSKARVNFWRTFFAGGEIWTVGVVRSG